MSSSHSHVLTTLAAIQQTSAFVSWPTAFACSAEIKTAPLRNVTISLIDWSDRTKHSQFPNEAKTSHCGINRVRIDPKRCACSRVHFCLCCCLFCVNYCYVSMFAWVHWCHSVTVECRCIYFPECSLVGQCVCGKPGPAPSTTTNSSLETCSPSFRYSPAADSPLLCYGQISVMFLLCSSNSIPSMASLTLAPHSHVLLVMCVAFVQFWYGFEHGLPFVWLLPLLMITREFRCDQSACKC